MASTVLILRERKLLPSNDSLHRVNLKASIQTSSGELENAGGEEKLSGFLACESIDFSDHGIDFWATDDNTNTEFSLSLDGSRVQSMFSTAPVLLNPMNWQWCLSAMRDALTLKSPAGEANLCLTLETKDILRVLQTQLEMKIADEEEQGSCLENELSQLQQQHDEKSISVQSLAEQKNTRDVELQKKNEHIEKLKSEKAQLDIEVTQYRERFEALQQDLATKQLQLQEKEKQV
jgi:hypothetical protein